MSSLSISTRAPTIGLTALSFLLASSLASAQVVPPSVTDTLYPGASTNVGKTVTTPEIIPDPDIVFLSDTTGSMVGAIANVKANASDIFNEVLLNSPNAQFAVTEYKDAGDGTPAFDCKLNQQLTANTTDVQNGINQWTAGGGGASEAEGQMTALTQIASAGTCDVTFRSNTTPVVVWFGDAPGKSPTASGHTLADAKAALGSIEAYVIALSVGANRLNISNQVTGGAGAILDDPNAVDGSFTSGVDPDNVTDEIIAALAALPITVTPVPSCDTGLNVTFVPTSRTVTSGENATFTETIAVASDPALAGTTLNCTVDFQSDTGASIGTQTIEIEVPIAIDLGPDTDTNELGFDPDHTVTATVTSGPVPIDGRNVSFEVTGINPEGPTSEGPTNVSGQVSFTYAPLVVPTSLGDDQIEGCIDSNPTVCDTVDKTWEDTTPPVVACVETVNPHGKKKPQAPGTGQNEDGFYQITATDVVWPEDSLEIFISGFGPFSSGDNVKITEDEYATPESKKMGSTKGKAGAIAAHLILNADPLVTAFDGSGNESDPVDCLVPPVPK